MLATCPSFREIEFCHSFAKYIAAKYKCFTVEALTEPRPFPWCEQSLAEFGAIDRKPGVARLALRSAIHSASSPGFGHAIRARADIGYERAQNVLSTICSRCLDWHTEKLTNTRIPGIVHREPIIARRAHHNAVRAIDAR